MRCVRQFGFSPNFYRVDRRRFARILNRAYMLCTAHRHEPGRRFTRVCYTNGVHIIGDNVRIG